ncbi:recombinase family protein [Sphingorhabdus sp.]|jgi:site-specific DNA recombinase|uniref:recombinase family protein n=1 Tax=Sphingorhabdus sp. TaxID=1902408 RepID=UPI0037C7B343
MERTKKMVRCAIYTRKSTEDGLEQEYNSLDAQYDACTAYALSQRHEGWTVTKDRYDDGGFSGGNLERPGLKRLLADIEAGTVDIILLYKIDRLTRSLSDFAKIVEILDRKGASFVSITQSFNTTTSMGRLTLNMLLSFAQFEREVTGERIRDKIYASKRKGIWMGGPVPLGYDVIDRKLLVNEVEAEQVRYIMQLYLKVGSVPELVDLLAKNGSHTKIQQRKDGGTRGGVHFKRGNLYHLLSNRVYRGMTVHKSEAFEGEHDAIVAEELWDQVQAKLAKQGQGGSSRRVSARTGVLAGLIYNAEGAAMVLTHTQKGNRRFHYYANRYENIGDSSASRVSARDIEDIVVGQLSQTLALGIQVQSVLLDGTYTADQLHNAISRCRQLADELTAAKYIRKQAIIRTVLDRVELHEDRVVIKIDNRSLLNAIGAEGSIQPSSSDLIIEREAIRLRRGKALRLIIPAALAGDGMSLRDAKLVALIAESRAIMAQIVTNPDKSVPTLAAEQGRCRVRMMKVAKLVCLDPYIVTAIVEGRQPLKLTPSKLLAADLPLAWPEQRRVLGFS